MRSQLRFQVSMVILGSALALVAARSPAGAGPGSRAGQQESILEDPTRPAEDRARDAGSRPLEVYAWLGIRPGMVVVDLVPYFGYNSHLLARLVGPSGRVLAVGTNEHFTRGLTERFERAGIDNVDIHELPNTVPDASVDVVVSVRNVHDMYIPEMGYGSRDEIFRHILRVLRPGGILGVVDARGPGPGVDAESHRIDAATVIADLEAVGFELAGQSELLATDDSGEGSADDRTKVDRFLLCFRKPPEAGEA